MSKPTPMAPYILGLLTGALMLHRRRLTEPVVEMSGPRDDPGHAPSYWRAWCYLTIPNTGHLYRVIVEYVPGGEGGE